MLRAKSMMTLMMIDERTIIRVIPAYTDVTCLTYCCETYRNAVHWLWQFASVTILISLHYQMHRKWRYLNHACSCRIVLVKIALAHFWLCDVIPRIYCFKWLNEYLAQILISVHPSLFSAFPFINFLFACLGAVASWWVRFSWAMFSFPSVTVSFLMLALIFICIDK